MQFFVRVKIQTLYSLSEFHSSPVAVVGLEMTSYITREDFLMIEVCAEVLDPDLECPVWFPFNISFTTADGSAGIMNILRIYSGR